MYSIETWKSKVNECEAVQSKMHEEWNTAIDLYNCEFHDNAASQDSDRVEVNFVNWYVTNLVSLCYFRDPYIFFKTETDSWERFAETLEKVVNKEWKRLDLKSQFKDVILSGLLTPPGFLKLGYTAKIGQDEAKHEENKEKEEAKSLVDSIKEVITGVVKEKKEALQILKYLPQKTGAIVWQTLYSAISNATNNFDLEKENLIIKEAFVNQGPILKRMRPRAQGRAFKIQKKMAHLTIRVSEL